VTQPNSKLLAIPTVVRGGCRLALAGALLVLAPASNPPLFAQTATTSLPRDASAAIEREGTTTRDDALKAFMKRVNDFTSLKKTLAGDLAKIKPGDPRTGQLEKHEDTLASRIMAARKDAKRGDIFGDAAPYFKRIIERDAQTRGLRDAYATMQEVPALSPPTVNALYPEKAALATVPPLILVNLPRLPDGLEYRFMGRDLILRDREANVIVDFIPGAVPILKP
jgi:hypothetical protein